MITSCPNCNCKFEADEAMAGKRVRCPKCQNAFTIASSSSSEASDVASQARASGPSGNSPGLLGTGISSELLLTIGKSALIAGLILVVFSRGCDSVGNRGVARRKAKLDEAKSRFEEKWDRKAVERGLEPTGERYDEIEALKAAMAFEEMRQLERQSEEDRRKRREEREKFETEKRRARQELEKDEWLDLESSARVADANNVVQGYWREWLFLVGSLALVMGALTVAFSGTGAERVVCLIVVGLIVFSIYIGGVAWAGSIINNVKGGAGIR